MNEEELKRILEVKGTEPEVVEEPVSDATQADPCSDSTPVNASDVCNNLATAEGNGTYTQVNSATGASGRYQFVESTAIGVLVKSGVASDKTQAKVIWDECKQSDSTKCKGIQDGMCSHFSETISKSLKNRGLPDTMAFRYLGHNQGAGGANVIWRSMQSGNPVTNPNVLRNMKGQAWEFSADGKQYYSNMVGYLKRKGVNLDA